VGERKVRMWAVWIPGQNRPAYVIATRDGASTCAGHEKFLVRVEVREVKARKSGKGKVKRGR